MLYSCVGCGLEVGNTKDDAHDALTEECIALSKSNDPPSPLLVYDNIRERYVEASDNLKALDSKIKKLSASMAALNEERARISKRKQIYKSILHPMRRLPLEVLTEIFRFCTSGSFTDLALGQKDVMRAFPGSLDTRQAPWVLGQVCLRWRLLTLSTADLWTRIDISWDVKPFSLDRAASLAHNLALQLQRCRDRPLAVSYNCAVDSDRNLRAQFALLLCSRSFQWEKARIQGDVDGLAPLRLGCGLLPSLKALHVIILDSVDDWSEMALGSIQVFERSPSLRHFVMSGDARAFLQQDNQVPWGQLVHYVFRKSDLWWPDLDDHYQILPQLENVQVCVLDSSVPISRNPSLPLQNTLVLRHLHTLILAHAEEDEMGAIGPLLRWLTLPALRILRLPLGFDCPDALVEFLNRSHCSLEELTIVEIENKLVDTMPDMIRVFEVGCLQKLHTLGLGGSSWRSEKEQTAWDTVFKALAFSQHSDRLLLPKLRRLMLYGLSMTWTDGALVKMIISRREGVEGWNTYPLEKVILWDVGHWDDRTDEASEAEMGQVLALRQDDFSLRVVRDERLDWYEVDVPCF
ncbi:hypothetical protein AAF712_009274 [Marasmius tenuissimus]|uniref:F-box domain-containing protein n=1 Tax=Marasmius tenuissimus TaxID=585030 RepID=A0ABR2ZRN5_9AGAR